MGGYWHQLMVCSVMCIKAISVQRISALMFTGISESFPSNVASRLSGGQTRTDMTHAGLCGPCKSLVQRFVEFG